jgi:hypothetical protein
LGIAEKTPGGFHGPELRLLEMLSLGGDLLLDAEVLFDRGDASELDRSVR